MKISGSPAGIVDLRRPQQGLENMQRAGFENLFLDVNMACSSYELENVGKCLKNGEEEFEVKLTPDDIWERLQRLTDKCRETGMNVPVMRAPYLLRDTKRTDLEELLLQIQEECIRHCPEIGSRYLIVRPLFAGVKREEEWEKNQAYYLRLASMAQKYDVMLLLENQCRDFHGHLVRGICSDGTVAAEWVDKLNQEAGEERFGFCVDVGVCTLCGQDMHEFALELGSRIKAVILRDCDGQRENALLPFTGVNQMQPQTDWLSLIRGLRETGFDGHLLLNIVDTAVGFSPLLRPQLLPLAKSVADYFQWQIEIEHLLKKYQSVVLFGAGNMCWNYMKCYGEKYPPLFTCDNNPEVWGTSVCGLEIKPPEALRELPENCGVFICNVFYDEVKKQLEDMGVRNIECFNDEYMPLYTRRVKGV